ncbi:MAG: PQQ-binding-like beta-propeller repeat protein [Halanaeroarchaeum sp.]
MSLSRRRLLRTAGAALAGGGLGALAGCSSSCPDESTPDPPARVGVHGSKLVPTQTAPTGSWPLERATPGNTGYSERGLSAGDLTVRVRTELDLPPTDEGRLSASSPTVSDGTAYVADRRSVHAVSLATGDGTWTSEPLSVTAADSVWEFEANTVAPAVGDGRVFVGTESGVVALDAATGRRRWAATGLRSVASPIVTDGAVVALGRETVVAFAPDGTERWRRAVDRGETVAAPAVGDGVVAVPVSTGVLGLDPSTGEERWRSSRRSEGPPVVTDGTVFVGDYEGLHALDAATGEKRWTFSRGDGRSFRSPVVTPDTIYTVEQPGEAGAASFALERQSGEPSPRWCSYIGSGAVTGATDDLVLAVLGLGEGPDAAQSVVAFTRSLGDAPWAIEGGSSPRAWVTKPAIVDGTVVVTTRGGTLVAVGGG